MLKSNGKLKLTLKSKQLPPAHPYPMLANVYQANTPKETQAPSIAGRISMLSPIAGTLTCAFTEAARTPVFSPIRSKYIPRSQEDPHIFDISQPTALLHHN
jgi:hypothetical protein